MKRTIATVALILAACGSDPIPAPLPPDTPDGWTKKAREQFTNEWAGLTSPINLAETLSRGGADQEQVCAILESSRLELASDQPSEFSPFVPSAPIFDPIRRYRAEVADKVGC